MRKVKFVPHDSKWRETFELESKSVADALGKNVVAVHHIGYSKFSEPETSISHFVQIPQQKNDRRGSV